MGFPPARGNANANVNSANKPEQGPVSTGSGGLPASLKVKASSIKEAPGEPKVNNQDSSTKINVL